MLKKIVSVIAAFILMTNIAYAKNWLQDIAKSAVLGTIAYHTYLNEMVKIGSNPRMQLAAYQEDVSQNGESEDEYDKQFVDEVMNQLINEGNYAMKETSLPFKWNVNNRDTFNAYCTAMNYVSVNKGLLTALNYNKDEVAAVLAHEMIHGLHQHVQYDVAKQAAIMYAAVPLAGDAMSATLLSIAVNYNNAKNVTAPSEKEADEYGFYLMTSAGFNPGGFAAMVSRMPNSPNETVLTPDDHPETKKRFQRAIQWLKEYSYNHITVDKNAIYIDNKFYKTVENTEEYTAIENACLQAGYIAKNFHENVSVVTWKFDDDVLKMLVEDAYKHDKDREKLQKKEKKREEKLEKKREKALKSNHSQRYQNNASAYQNIGMLEQAQHELMRARNSVY